ncbi:MAG TPA: glycosyltransferase [Thermoanaerobacterales bacterium]|nr:glycosyltransferase [Thermoanaerobacterales bacterium]
MIAAVIPAQNEEERISYVIKNTVEAGVDQIYVIVNGSSDNTFDEVNSISDERINIILFRESLGIDVPRAIGAFEAYKRGAKVVVFIDGDMIGNITPIIKKLIISIKKYRNDLSLTNCYPKIPSGQGLSSLIIDFRLMLNKSLGIYNHIGVSTPSHGPHAISRHLLDIVPFKEIAMPPVVLALAVKSNLKIHVSSTVPHYKLGSKAKNSEHSRKIAETIIGDCLEAICVYSDIERSRVYEGYEYIGYNNDRRIDILEEYLEKID